jgi:hypothetical protein
MKAQSKQEDSKEDGQLGRMLHQGPPPGDYGAAPPLTRIGYGQEKVGNIYSVHNNLPYAEPLANGSSKQASPGGWVQGIAKDVQGRVIAAAAKIGRES